MASGLDAPQTGSGFDPASQMLYDSDDMGAFAANHPLSIPPGPHWAYTSVKTLILNRIMSQLMAAGLPDSADLSSSNYSSRLA